jgi:hypothetical protein
MFLLLGNKLLIMQQLDYNNGNGVFYTWSAQRGYKQGEVWSLVKKYKRLKLGGGQAYERSSD